MVDLIERFLGIPAKKQQMEINEKRENDTIVVSVCSAARRFVGATNWRYSTVMCLLLKLAKSLQAVEMLNALGYVLCRPV